MQITKTAEMEYIATGTLGALVGSLSSEKVLKSKDPVNRAILGGLLAMGALAYYKHINRDVTNDHVPEFEPVLTRRDHYVPRDA
jgi:hypothetical protein